MKKYEDLYAQAQRLLQERFSTKQISGLTSDRRTADRIDILREAVKLLILNDIPTQVIGAMFKKTKGSIQYHARQLERNEAIVRPHPNAHWKHAVATK